MAEIKFSRYREYVSARVEANNAMIALLAGSRLSAHNLQLHAGSPHQLPGLFPAVEDIDRFNLLPDRASELLIDADAHLAAVSIPYALAVYEAFVKDAIGMLDAAGYSIPSGRYHLNAGRMHQTLYEAAGEDEPLDVISLFHVLRTARNAQIHHAGFVTSEVKDAVDALDADQLARWEQLTMAPVGAMFSNGKLRFKLGHLIASFAVTKEAARRINSLLGQKLSRDTWLHHVVEDYTVNAKQHPKNRRQWKRGLKGFARFHYEELKLSEAELDAAVGSTH
ncbi:hypothetical protein [Microbacterium sp.]|uniref:hypothetical protein n=1 Tax=Microbacterium sp. TaxID=51671 RepID=UPI003F9CFD03